jgi:hypothetical protein
MIMFNPAIIALRPPVFNITIWLLEWHPEANPWESDYKSLNSAGDILNASLNN